MKTFQSLMLVPNSHGISKGAEAFAPFVLLPYLLL